MIIVIEFQQKIANVFVEGPSYKKQLSLRD